MLDIAPSCPAWSIRTRMLSGPEIAWQTSMRASPAFRTRRSSRRGGGIWSTIRATAAASKDELLSLARPRIEALVRSGATVIEVKSGYGFASDKELAMLEVIRCLSDTTPARLVPTLLIHVPPKEASDRAAYVSDICQTLIPEVARQKLAVAVDVFVEKEAWSAAGS